MIIKLSQPILEFPTTKLRSDLDQGRSILILIILVQLIRIINLTNFIENVEQ